MKTTGTKKYIVSLIFSSLFCIALVALVVIFNDQSENDLLYVVDTVGIGLSIGIISSLIVIIFFHRRDTRYIHAREQRAARKIAAEIRRHSRAGGIPTKLPEVYQKVAYLYDAFHSELNEDLSVKIDNLLQQSPPSEATLKSIMTLIDKKYPEQSK